MAQEFQIGTNPNANLNDVYTIFAKRAVEEIEALIQTNLIDSPESERRKKNTKQGTGTLRSFAGSNGLERSFQIGNSNNIYKPKGSKTTYGSNVIYSAIHEFGGKAGRNLSATIPARPYFRPAIAEWESEFMVSFMIDFANAIADELGIELE